jgi:hypothetical protein
MCRQEWALGPGWARMPRTPGWACTPSHLFSPSALPPFRPCAACACPARLTHPPVLPLVSPLPPQGAISSPLAAWARRHGPALEVQLQGEAGKASGPSPLLPEAPLPGRGSTSGAAGGRRLGHGGQGGQGGQDCGRGGGPLPGPDAGRVAAWEAATEVEAVAAVLDLMDRFTEVRASPQPACSCTCGPHPVHTLSTPPSHPPRPIHSPRCAITRPACSCTCSALRGTPSALCI